MVLRWLCDRWYIPLLVIGALAAWIFVRRARDQGQFFSTIKTELEAIDAQARVRELVTQAGSEHARAYVENRYKETLQRLDETQAIEAEVLTHDPAKLAAYLVRVGSSRSRNSGPESSGGPGATLE